MNESLHSRCLGYRIRVRVPDIEKPYIGERHWHSMWSVSCCFTAFFVVGFLLFDVPQYLMLALWDCWHCWPYEPFACMSLE